MLRFIFSRGYQIKNIMLSWSSNIWVNFFNRDYELILKNNLLSIICFFGITWQKYFYWNVLCLWKFKFWVKNCKNSAMKVPPVNLIGKFWNSFFARTNMFKGTNEILKNLGQNSNKFLRQQHSSDYNIFNSYTYVDHTFKSNKSHFSTNWKF